MEEPARRFQSQVSKAPPGWAYRVEDVVMEDGTIKPKVDFDGFTDNVLLEVKGPGYAKFLKNGAFPWWFKGAEGMVLQAQRQLRAANGLTVRWHVAEREVADAIRALLSKNGYNQIDVVFTPPIPQEPSSVFENYYAGCYWFNRSESTEECARRAETLFRVISGCDPLFSRWFEKGNSFKEARKLAFEPSAETFLKFFARKEYQFTPRFFHVGVWNGENDDDAIGVSFSCGVIGSQSPGSCIIDLPSHSPSAERLLTGLALAQMLRCMVAAWDPDWGVVTSDPLRALVSRTAEVGTFPGWLTYFSHRMGTVPPLPEPIRVEPVESKGTLVVLTPERVTARNPAHAELAVRVGEQLEKAGLLRPLASPPSKPTHGD